MESSELRYEISLSYYDLCDYLIEKYGAATSDYFYKPPSKNRNPKVSRAKEGLYCHHIDEDKGGNLSTYSPLNPPEWQLKERLVYCNAIEHLVLHIKIAVLRHKIRNKTSLDVLTFFTTGGIYQVCSTINDLIDTEGGITEWRKCCYSEIKQYYNDYISILSSVIVYLKNNYWGDVEECAYLRKGSIIDVDNRKAEILALTKDRAKAKVKLDNGEVCDLSVSLLLSHLSFRDVIDIVVRQMAQGFTDFYESIYNDIFKSISDYSTHQIAELWEIDHKGYGFIRYSDISLGDEYGSENADEYVSYALPMFSNPTFEPLGRPIFWKGSRLPENTKSSYFILRFETIFELKEGESPSILYRGWDISHRPIPKEISDDYNMIYKKPVLLRTSKVLNSKAELIESPVILTLGRDDLVMFLKRYSVGYIRVLDGCYFI